MSQTTRRDLFGAAGVAAAGIAAVAGPTTIEAQEKIKKFLPLENFKYDLEAQTHWTGEGGSAKEATIVQFPVSESIAGVSMRLKPGAMRELHWHAIAAEWAYVIEGNVRATVISPNTEAEQTDFGPGDIWYFPKGHGHALQNLGPGDAHFLIVFDNGAFSEFGTLSVTDWLALTSPEVVVRNLGLPADVVAKLPRKEVYITPGKIPPAVPEAFINGNPSENQHPHKYRLGKATPHVESGKSWIKLVTQKEFPIQSTLSAAVEVIEPGGMREMHWHPNADEWQYYLSGKARVRIFGGHQRILTEEFSKGHVGFIRQGFGHYVENIGTEPLKFIAMFNSPFFEEISITSWLSGNPPGILSDNLGISKEMIAKLPKSPRPFV